MGVIVLDLAPICVQTMCLMDFDSVTFELRPSDRDDFEFAWRLYRDSMKPPTIELLNRWNEAGQMRVVRKTLADEGASIIVINDSDAGWLYVRETRNRIYLRQLFIAPDLQNLGIGTAVLRHLINRARHGEKALTLDVMRNNRARSLYERLGFHVIGESEYKFKMQWQN